MTQHPPYVGPAIASESNDIIDILYIASMPRCSNVCCLASFYIFIYILYYILLAMSPLSCVVCLPFLFLSISSSFYIDACFEEFLIDIAVIWLLSCSALSAPAHAARPNMLYPLITFSAGANSSEPQGLYWLRPDPKGRWVGAPWDLLIAW